MTVLNILEFPDERLRRKASLVEQIDGSIQTIIADMFETMYEAKGIGLAATQVNILKRIVVMDLSEEKDQPFCIINPEVTEPEGEESYDEGCLSVPGFYETVTRPEKVRITGLDRDGKAIDIHADGMLAICIQHEIDHLDGKLFVDYLTPLKRQRIRQKLVKAQRQSRETEDAN